MPIAHVRPLDENNTWFLEQERFEAATRVMAARGFTVVPVPDDGRQHPYAEPCPYCQGDLAGGLT